MAADVTVPNDLSASANTHADNTDANYAALVSWLNTNALHLDGAKAFTAVPSGPAADATTSDQLVRKSQADAVVVPIFARLSRVAAQSTVSGDETAIIWDTENADATGFIAVSDSLITVPTGQSGFYAIGFRVTLASAHLGRMRLYSYTYGAIMFDNGTTTRQDVDGFINVYLAAGEVVYLSWLQSTGSSQNVTARITLNKLSS